MNPFSPLGDFNLGALDPSKFGIGNFDMSKMFTWLKLPGADLEGLKVAQRTKMEALAESNRAAVSGMQTIVKRQAEILGETMVAASAAVQGLVTMTDPRERAAKQIDLTNAAFEKALANMKEFADAVAKSTDQSLSAINKQVVNSLDEIWTIAANK